MTTIPTHIIKGCTEQDRLSRQQLQDGLVSFGMLPAGEPVQVICVTENNGQPMACIRKTVIGREAMAALRFEPIDPKTFREKLLLLD